jgi:hypothetical protein
MSRSRLLGCIIAVVSCASDGVVDEMEVMQAQLEVWSNDDQPPVVRVATPAPPPDEASETETSPQRDAAPPNRCERLRVKIDANGRRRYQRIRRPWTHSDQDRFAKLVSLVAAEMGAEPKLLRAWAQRESSYRPTAIHVLNQDVEAATSAWRKLYYSPTEEAQLEAVMAEAGQRSDRYWKAKARLQKIRTFRGNRFLDDHVEYELVEPDGTVSRGTEPAWAFGYGPFGFNPAYFVPIWDAQSPPWIFCDEDGLAAIVTAVWAARTSQRDCERQGFGGSYAVVNRRFGTGHCAEVGPNAKFRTRARRLGLDPNARARLGSKWKRASTDRAEILAHMRTRAREAGLTGGAPPPDQRVH